MTIKWTRSYGHAYWSGASGTETFNQREHFGISKSIAPGAPTVRQARHTKRRPEFNGGKLRTYAYTVTVRTGTVSTPMGWPKQIVFFPTLDAAKAAAETYLRDGTIAQAA